MNRLFKAAIASVAVAATAFIPVSQSFAGDRFYGGRGYHSDKYDRFHRHHRSKRPVVVYRDRSGDALAAGVLGLAIGAIIAGAATAPDPYPPYDLNTGNFPGNYPPAPAPYQGHASYSYSGVAEPWTQAWYSYCTQRFRSFDAKSGTYLGYDGKRHFCVAK